MVLVVRPVEASDVNLSSPLYTFYFRGKRDLPMLVHHFIFFYRLLIYFDNMYIVLSRKHFFAKSKTATLKKWKSM